jgi:hypothetical protein
MKDGLSVGKVRALISPVDSSHMPAIISSYLEDAITVVTRDGKQLKLAEQIEVKGLPSAFQAFKCFAIVDGPFAHSTCIIQKSASGASHKKGCEYSQFVAAVQNRKNHKHVYVVLANGIKVVLADCFLLSLVSHLFQLLSSITKVYLRNDVELVEPSELLLEKNILSAFSKVLSSYKTYFYELC